MNFAREDTSYLLAGVQMDIIYIVQAFLVAVHHGTQVAVDGEGIGVLDYLTAGELVGRVDGESCRDIGSCRAMRYREFDSEAAILEWMGGENYKFNRCHNFCKFFLVLKSETKKKQVRKSKFGLIGLFF